MTLTRRQLLCSLPAVPALGALATSAGAAAPVPAGGPALAVNLKHLEHLYAEVEVGGKALGVVHIYAAYPDYRYDVEPNEGFACVDDVARAVVLLSREWRQRAEAELLRKIEHLTEFLLHLQNANGYFNNFLWGDLRINVDYRTSVAALNWWSFRALWALEEALPVLESNAALAMRMREAAARVVGNIVRDLPSGLRRTRTSAGIRLPDWLPEGSGADQAAEAMVALLPHWRRTGDAAVRRLITSLAQGILLMQKGDARTYPYGMFLSWRHHWHAWGNVQAYALLVGGEALGEPGWTQAALVEVDNFYPRLLEQGLAEGIELRAKGAVLTETARRRFPQIAYGLRPMVFAALKAHAVTGEARYRRLADNLGAWLQGRNDAGAPVYDPVTGRAMDGIIAPGTFNRNSGAESTIEALLSVQALRDGTA